MTPEYEKAWLERMYPGHDEWKRDKLGLKEGETPPPPPTAEEQQAARAAREAEVAAGVKRVVKIYRPDLLEDADRKPKGAEPKTEQDREVAAEAERYLKGVLARDR